jgi:hypothetical protein
MLFNPQNLPNVHTLIYSWQDRPASAIASLALRLSPFSSNDFRTQKSRSRLSYVLYLNTERTRVSHLASLIPHLPPADALRVSIPSVAIFEDCQRNPKVLLFQHACLNSPQQLPLLLHSTVPFTPCFTPFRRAAIPYTAVRFFNTRPKYLIPLKIMEISNASL